MSVGLINILAVVDVQSVLAGAARWYLADDDLGSENEGSQGLTTECNAGDILYFRADPIVEGQPVTITSVGPGPAGAYIFGFNQPVNQGGGLWSWQTQNAGSGGYSMNVLCGGVQALTISGDVTVQPATQQLQIREERTAVDPSPFQLIDIVVAVNTEAIVAGYGVPGSVYMMDNSSASSGEGSTELLTVCNAGDTLRWHCVAINGVDTVAITGFQQSQGNVFGNNSPAKVGDEWTWTTANPGSNDTYQIRIIVNGQYTGSWDPHITVNSAAVDAAVNAAQTTRRQRPQA